MSEKQDWSDVDRLISEAKFEAASEAAGQILATARQAGDAEETTRALIKLVQLRTGLHGYETAVRFLREETWPEEALQNAVLSLFYGRSLVTYLQSYSWEIGQRERVDTGDVVDLKAWTREQIGEEAQRAYLEVWNGRQEWGSDSLGTLAEYVDQNDYPPRIRGTLRDAVTYLWVEMLADTSMWRPEHSSQVYRLDLGDLLATDPSDVALDDPEVHPLSKLVSILADLEGWHLERGQPEAAFAARLERIQRLWNSFTEASDQKTVRESLEGALDNLGSRYAWWSMGMAQLAEHVRGSGELVEARRIALDGQQAHPGSPGGQRCRHVVASIEAPAFSIMAMASDNPDRRSILVDHRNLEAVHFRAYEIDIDRRIELARDRNLLPAYRDVPGVMSGSPLAAEWSIELPATPDYQSHLTYVTPPMTDRGVYLVVASARRDFARDGNQQTAVNIVVGDLVLLHRTSEKSVDITVRSGESGRSLGEVEVDLYRYDYRQGHQRVRRVVTDSNGVARFEVADFRRANFFVLARRGNDLGLMQNVRPPYPHRGAKDRVASLIYTDRSVYRPQQKVLWKVVAYRGAQEEGRFRLMPKANMTVELIDANGQSVASQSVSSNDFGSVSGEFEIPSGRLLGHWQVRSSLNGYSQIKVEEYKRPTFEVTVSDPEKAMRLNQPATLGGEVRYYFGLPVTAGDIEWQVVREPVYPRWGWYFWNPPAIGQETIATGEGSLDAEGRFELTFTPEADERLGRGVSYRYRLSVDVTDEGGETRSASRAFRLGFVAVEATIGSDAEFLRAGEPATFTLRRSDLDGVPRAGEGKWQLLALEQPAKTLLPADQPLPSRHETSDADKEAPYQTPGDLLRPRWQTNYSPAQTMALWKDGAEQRSGTVTHGEDGNAELALSDLEPGAYRLRYTTRDDFGAEFETQRDLLVVASRATPLALPAVLLAEASSVPVGDVARLFVHSGLEDQEMLLEIYQQGRRVEARRLESGGEQVVEIPVGMEHRGGFSARLVSLRDHQLISLQSEIFVPWDDRRLKLEFSTFRDRLRPGDRETWRVVVRGSDEEILERGAAEVLAYMYDRSLDIFAPHRPADPLSLYPRNTYVPDVLASLGVANRAWHQNVNFVNLPGYVSFRGDQLKFYDNYGIGGPGRRNLRMKRVAARRPMAMAEAAPAPQAMMADAAVAGEARAEEMVVQLDRAESPPPVDDSGDAPSEELRTDFSETAFWEPHLTVGDDGSVAFEFEVPDSVTEWNVWVHSVTRDLRAGSLERQTKTVKELLVRPYLPRFLREGDRAALEVVINNAGEESLTGTLDFEIVDPETDASLLTDFGLDATATSDVPFSVEAGGGTTLSFAVRAPSKVGPVAFRVIGRAGDFSDGELRPLPVLPGRLHLAQSRFVTLRDAEKRALRFADMEADDPTRIDQQLVVTLDAQLFYSVLDALPYLASYPYECTEQLLNRFLSTGIVSSLYDEYPSVAQMAKQLSARETQFEQWDLDDPNRKMTLEETPWLRPARGGKASGEHLINVLDPSIARAQREASLAKLREAQTSIGGFPWWPGGPPSPYITLYLLQGFSRALEFDVEVPQDMVVQAWSYMHRHYLDKLVRDMTRRECCWELVTYLNFVLSSYPDTSWTGGVFTDDDRKTMLDFSFSHWKRHSPRLKGYLALTLQRAGREAEAELVFDSVMDSAKTTRDEGTFWAPEDRAWLWYNDTIESHAFALRTLTELDPDDARRHGLVQWLLLNKKLNHWKSTRATAEVIYSLVHYLEREGTLGIREEATVVAGPREETFTWEPDTYTGKSQLVLVGEEIDPETMSTIEVEKETKGFMFASATWHFSTEQLPEEERGDFFAVSRRYFKRVHDGREWVLQPLADGTRLEPGDQLEVQLSLRAKHASEYVHLRDPRGAGFEPETSASGYKWDLGIGWYEEVRDSGTNFFFEWLPAGEYNFKYRLRASLAGTFRAGPATVQSMYAPEFVAYSSGAELAIGGDKN